MIRLTLIFLFLTVVVSVYGQDYEVSTYDMNWYQASQYCKGNGKKLVKITDSAQQTQAATYLNSQDTGGNRLFWTGLTDLAQEGRYQWEDGTLATYTNWYPGEPNDADGTSDCIHMDFGYKNRQWTDSNCYIPNAFAFCEN